MTKRTIKIGLASGKEFEFVNPKRWTWLEGGSPWVHISEQSGTQFRANLRHVAWFSLSAGEKNSEDLGTCPRCDSHPPLVRKDNEIKCSKCSWWKD